MKRIVITRERDGYYRVAVQSHSGHLVIYAGNSYGLAKTKSVTAQRVLGLEIVETERRSEWDRSLEREIVGLMKRVKAQERFDPCV